MDAAQCEASYHHVAVGCLVLYGGADVGESGLVLSDPLYVAFAPGVLAGKQIVIYEVGASSSSSVSRSPVDCASTKRRTKALFFCSEDTGACSSFPARNHLRVVRRHA